MTSIGSEPGRPEEDPLFPVLHRVPRQGWINDPNGIMRIGDRWHVFFQFNPHSARHDRIRWGHVSSADLVRWEEEPLGPVPRAGQADAGGCWSGVGVLDETGPALLYSAVDGIDNQRSRVILARLDPTGRELVGGSRVVADVPAIDGLLGVRDPFLFEAFGRQWAIQGAGIRQASPAAATATATAAGEDPRIVPSLLLFSCDDLESWTFEGELMTGEDPLAGEVAPAEIWECPQLVRVGQDWVLLVSLWFREQVVPGSITQTVYLVGDLEQDEDGRPRFTPRAGGRADDGPDLYAPQAVRDPAGERVLLWGWSWEGRERTPEQTDAQGWAGCLTFPRELVLEGDQLLARAPRELLGLRGEELEIGGDGTIKLDVPARAEVELASSDVQVEILAPDGSVRPVDLEGEDVRQRVAPGSGGARSASAGLGGSGATLFLDGSILEILPERSAPRTVRLYPRPGDRVRIRGTIRRAWSLTTEL